MKDSIAKPGPWDDLREQFLLCEELASANGMKNIPTFGERAFRFYTSLELRNKLPRGVVVMNPYRTPRIRDYIRLFLSTFFSDNHKRVLVFGINPGRFGAGITGVTFTDPIALETFCAVPNDLPKKRELSSVFIYEFIKLWGGPKKFYRKFFLTAVSPLGFVKEGRNFNFYDHPTLLRNIKPFLIRSIEFQLRFGARREAAIVLGTGKIKQVFEDLNRECNFFKTVHALEHPRFIMQYRRRKLRDYLPKYSEVFKQALQE
ncbi:MAG TPA: uracil-DNA glycosylase family protein [Thermodesulfobacteriota bacterium]